MWLVSKKKKNELLLSLFIWRKINDNFHNMQTTEPRTYTNIKSCIYELLTNFHCQDNAISFVWSAHKHLTFSNTNIVLLFWNTVLSEGSKREMKKCCEACCTFISILPNDFWNSFCRVLFFLLVRRKGKTFSCQRKNCNQWLVNVSVK